MNQVERNDGKKTVWAISDAKSKSTGRSWWTKIGVGYVNRDGSINLKLDAFPIGASTIQVRDFDPRELAEKKTGTDALPSLEAAPRGDVIDNLF